MPTVPGREPKLARLLRSLDDQIRERSDVELLVLRDNRSRSIGSKRNALVTIALGEYVAFVDDDDLVAPQYVSTICDCVRGEHPDVATFTVLVRRHGRERPCRYHPAFSHVNLANEYRRKPNHLCVWRRELAASRPFPDLRYGEDTAWATAMAPLAQRVSVIDQPLYVYDFDPKDNSRCR